jgi:hypothetical protein
MLQELKPGLQGKLQKILVPVPIDQETKMTFIPSSISINCQLLNDSFTVLGFAMPAANASQPPIARPMTVECTVFRERQPQIHLYLFPDRV